ncbi:MAG: ParA family protein [Eggerthellaceae bacterium]
MRVSPSGKAQASQSISRPIFQETHKTDNHKKPVQRRTFRHAFVFPSVRETGETRVFDELLTNVRILDPAGPCNRGFVCVRFVAASSLPALRTIETAYEQVQSRSDSKSKAARARRPPPQAGVALAMSGKRVLLIDADPQGDLTASLGWRNPDELETTLATHLEAVARDEPLEPDAGILKHPEGVDLMPANIELSGTEVALVTAMNRERTLKAWLDEAKRGYDYALIDCMPSLGMLAVNALAAADSVIVPVQAQYLPAKGMTQLVKTIGRVKRQINPH